MLVVDILFSVIWDVLDETGSGRVGVTVSVKAPPDSDLGILDIVDEGAGRWERRVRGCRPLGNEHTKRLGYLNDFGIGSESFSPGPACVRLCEHVWLGFPRNPNPKWCALIPLT